MIVLAVLSYNGAPADGLAASFDELGGTIGRAENNHLVLPDPERTISRVHARVVFRSHGYVIVDNGSNPISINGAVVGAGSESLLTPGDQIQIGGYLLKVSTAASATASSDPFADLFGEAAVGLAVPPTVSPAPASSFAPVRQAPPPAWSTPAAPPSALAPGYIPDDWNPFAPDVAPAVAPRLPELSGGQASADTLDSLFGLTSSPKGIDPLQALGSPVGTPMAGASAPDHVSELNTPMPLARPVAPPGAVFSWDAAKPMAHTDAAPVAALTPRPQSPPAAATSAPAHAPARAPAAGEAALLAALLEGLGTPNLRLDALSPELMRLVGQLLRESMRGTVELLLARAALKRELRAEMTMIVARENNPLKFSPSVDMALQHLLAAPTPGFMSPRLAVRDAFDDLRAHQLGVMAGMKAALEGVLQRFDPQLLESKLTRKSALSSLIPSTRKARLWELFQELFTQLSSEAEDDFEELFGREFLLAYEAQLDRLHGEPEPE